MTEAGASLCQSETKNRRRTVQLCLISVGKRNRARLVFLASQLFCLSCSGWGFCVLFCSFDAGVSRWGRVPAFWISDCGFFASVSHPQWFSWLSGNSTNFIHSLGLEYEEAIQGSAKGWHCQCVQLQQDLWFSCCSSVLYINRPTDELTTNPSVATPVSATPTPKEYRYLPLNSRNQDQVIFLR